MSIYFKFNSTVIGTLLIVCILYSSCQKDEIKTTVISSEEVTNNKNVTFYVSLKQQNGERLNDVQLLLSNSSKKYTQDENGIFILDNISVAELGTKITCSKEGYFTQFKMLTGESSSINIMEVILIKKDGGQEAQTGEKINLDGNGSLQIPNLLLDNNGNDYTGGVRVLNHYFDPDDDEMLNDAPGNMIGINSRDEFTVLGSFGMYLVELQNPKNGNELHLKEGYPATLSFPIADSQLDIVPVEIPLWSFDEEVGFWREEDQAILENDMLIAEVTHFSFWNCDLPYFFEPICLTFVDGFGNPMVGLEVNFKVNGQFFGNDVTNDEGRICGKFPLGEIIQLKFYLEDVTIIQSLDIGPFGTGSDDEIVVLEGPLTVKGEVVNCDGNPVSLGYGLIELNGNTELVIIDEEGKFFYWEYNDVNHQLNLVDLDVPYYTSLYIEASIDNIDLGIIELCGEELTSTISGKVFLDQDEDGVSDVPVENVIIEIKNVLTDIVEFTVLTDVNGEYTQVVIPQVEYEISALAPNGMKVIFHGDKTPDDFVPQEEWTSRTRDGIYAMVDPIDELDSDNDFQLINDGTGIISGVVMGDEDGDLVGDVPFANFSLTLISYTQGTIQETNVKTDSDGKFSIDVPNMIGEIKTSSVSLLDFDSSPDPDGDDSSLGANRTIPIRLKSGEVDADNNFLFFGLGIISGLVYEDTDNDGVGDAPIIFAEITLINDLTGGAVSTIVDNDGQYRFEGIVAGDYTLVEQDLAEVDEDFVDVYDGDDSPEDANDAVDGLNDNMISVTLKIGEHDSDNNFVEIQHGSISGVVSLDSDGDMMPDTPLEGITMILEMNGLSGIQEVVTDEDGNYTFNDLPPFGYIVRIKELGSLLSVTDFDELPDGDFEDSNMDVDNEIRVGLIPGEDDDGNNFTVK